MLSHFFYQASQKDLDAFDHRVESAKKQSVFASNEIAANAEDDNQLNDSANSDDVSSLNSIEFYI